eukprot:Tamp_17174.p1 GENE.Tamp_17174~~Tamp_17174.p1  ORF type:complete len:276 (+),score=86.66 Tamp_17174:163-990(+)
MDPILVKGLREAKQLLDDGILSAAEFEKEKAVLLQKRDLRVQREAARAREDPERRFRSDGANNTFCSRCGRPGHNKRSCTEEESALGPKKRRKKYRFPEDMNGKRMPPKPRWSREPTCYALFFGHELKKMKADDTEKKLKISDAAKVVAQKWKGMSDEEKSKWKKETKAEDGEGSGGVIVGITGMPGMPGIPGMPGMPGPPPPPLGLPGGGMMAMGAPMMPGLPSLGGAPPLGAPPVTSAPPPATPPAPDGPPLGAPLGAPVPPPVPAPQVPLPK